MYSKVKDFLLKNERPLLFLYGLLAIIAALQEYYGGVKKINDLPYDYTHYNNYLIFKYSFFHLLDGRDLYAYYLNEHWDLFKYSPSFALGFGAFAWMPDLIGLIGWNLLNALCLFVGIRMLPSLDLEKRNIVILFSMVELLTSLQNAQSNALIAGLILIAFAMIERQQFFVGCLLIALTVYIKLFGVFAFAICLLYPQRWKMVGYSVISMIVLAALPLLFMGPSQLMLAYESWWRLLQSDYIPNDLSLIGVVRIWTGIRLNQNLTLLMGIVLLMIPFVKHQNYRDLRFRTPIVSMILMWMIVFNHKAESPTFVIAVVGVGIWFFSSTWAHSRKLILLWLTLVLTSLSPTDLFPDFIQDNFFVPWAVKAIPCIVVYIAALYELMFSTQRTSS